MILESIYNLNQKVWRIERKRKNVFVNCETCEGTGEVVFLRQDGNVNTRTCPYCYGTKGCKKWHDSNAWKVEGKLTIGKIQIEITNIKADGVFSNMGHYEEGKTEKEITYMAYETGIGGGSIWKEEYLFPSQEEAQAKCDQLNKGETNE